MFRGSSKGVALLAAIATTAHSLAQTHEGGGLREFYTANGLLQRGLHDLAIPEYERFIEAHPRHEHEPAARYGLAVALVRAGRSAEAAEHLDRLLPHRAFRFAPEVLLLRGQVALEQGEAATARELLLAMLDRHADHAAAPHAAGMLAEACYRSGDFAGAIESSDLLAGRFPAHAGRARAELVAGLAAVASGDDAEGTRRLEALLERDPTGAHAPQGSLVLAEALHRLGRPQQAARWYEMAMRAKDGDVAPAATLGMARLRFAEGDLRRASGLLDRLLDQGGGGPTHAQAALLRGRVHLEAGEFDAAEALLARLSEAGAAEVAEDARFWLAKSALRAGRPEEAAGHLRTLLARGQAGDLAAAASYDLGVALMRSGDARGAEAAFASFLDEHGEHPLHADALRARAQLAQARGDHAAVRALVDGLVASRPDAEDGGELEFLGAESAFLAGDDAEAEARLRALLERGAIEDDLGRRVRYRLGLTLARQGRFDEARPLLESVVAGGRTEPRFAPALLALGDGHLGAGSWKDAHAAFEGYLRAAEGGEAPPDSIGDALLKLAVARLREGRLREALEPLQRVLALESDEPSERGAHARFELAQALVLLGEGGRAEAEFEGLLEAHPHGPFAAHALRHLATLASNGGRHGRAAECWGRLAELQQGDERALATMRRGRALAAAEDPEGARAAFALAAEQASDAALRAEATARGALSTAHSGDHERTVLATAEALALADRLDPDLKRSLLYERAWAQRSGGQLDEAAETYRLLLADGAVGEPRAYVLVDLAALEMEAGRHDDAAGLLLEARDLLAQLEVEPALAAQADYRLGVAQLRLERYEAAAAVLEPFERRHAGSELAPSACLLAGEALLGAQRPERAARSLRRVVEGHPRSDALAPALLRLGEAEAQMQRWGASERAFATFLERFGKDDLAYQARFGLGWAMENQGQFDGAIAAYRELVESHRGPTAARAQFQIGECLFAQGKLDEAARELLRTDILYAVPEWSAAALYEAGRVFEQMNKAGEARTRYADVVARFGESTWARLAQERLEAMGEHARVGGKHGGRGPRTGG